MEGNGQSFFVAVQFLSNFYFNLFTCPVVKITKEMLFFLYSVIIQIRQI